MRCTAVLSLLLGLCSPLAAQQLAVGDCTDLPAPVTTGTRVDLGPATLLVPSGWSVRLSREATRLRDEWHEGGQPIDDNHGPDGARRVFRRGADGGTAERAAAAAGAEARRREARPVTSELRGPRGRSLTLSWLPRGVDAIGAPMEVGTREACLSVIDGATLRLVRLEHVARGSVHEVVVHPAGGGTGAIMLRADRLTTEELRTLVAIALGVRATAPSPARDLPAPAAR